MKLICGKTLIYNMLGGNSSREFLALSPKYIQSSANAFNYHINVFYHDVRY